MRAEIITIGDEILIGQVVDTNSAWIAEVLQPVGMEIYQITSVSDSKQHIIEALDNARRRVDLVLITGGLGPTKDDITKKTLAEYFQSEMVMNQEVLEHVREIFKKRNLPMLDVNEQQALMPAKCTPLFNQVGTAPGMWFNDNGKHFVSMPGVPYEMKKMMTDLVIPRIKETFQLPHIIHKTFLTAGIGESFLSKKIESIEDNLPPYIKLAYLPHFSTVRLRFSARGTDLTRLNSDLEAIAAKLKQLIPEYIAAEGDRKIQEEVGRILTEKQETVSTAESCTGGYIAHMLTQVPGSSAYFKGSVIAYSNEIKTMELGVSENTLAEKGAVSEEVVRNMAESIRKKFDTTYGVATSGVAGPGGGTAEKPVGLVWIAVAGPGGTTAKEYRVNGERLQVIERSAMLSMDMLRKKITG